MQEKTLNIVLCPHQYNQILQKNPNNVLLVNLKIL